MDSVPEGNFLFIRYGFEGEPLAPHLTLHRDGAEDFNYFAPRGHSFTLTFDVTRRFCTGWHDLASNRSFPCPDAAELPEKYEQCRRCVNKTGFNPAFYHAKTVSAQQLTRNAEPHLLYLAHFGTGVVKVGISWAGRGLRRLLDQGARSGLVLKTYPNADVARGYEAAIARLPGIAETIQPRKKQQLLGLPYDAAAAAAELLAARQRLVAELGIKPEDNQPQYLDPYYLAGAALRPAELADVTADGTIAGLCLGMVGGRLVCEHGGEQRALALSKLTGYRCDFDSQVAAPAPQPPRQISLF